MRQLVSLLLVLAAFDVAAQTGERGCPGGAATFALAAPTQVSGGGAEYCLLMPLV